jgi:hypothetical protein
VIYKNRGKKRKGKFNRTSITNHRYMIRQHFKLNQVYTQQNISLDVGQELYDNQIFQNLSKTYQYFKLANVRVDFTPVTMNGTQPPVGYCLFVGNEDKASYILYSSIPELSYSKKIDNLKSKSYLFTRPGRQADFNYWYNTNVSNYAISCYLKMHFETTFQANAGYYMVRISYDLRFDKPYVLSVTNKELKESFEIAKSEGKLLDKDEEALDLAFKADPSEDDA